MKSRTPRLVLIHWLDANGHHTDGQVTPVHGLTAGWVISDEPEFLRLASEIFEDGDARELSAIPKAIVKEVLVRPVRLPPEFKGWRVK